MNLLDREAAEAERLRGLLEAYLAGQGDVVNMHQFVLEVTDAMSPADQKRWKSLMKSVGGDVFVNTRVPRPIVMAKDRKPYQLVLGRKSA